jgi:hypothetical protein
LFNRTSTILGLPLASVLSIEIPNPASELARTSVRVPEGALEQERALLRDGGLLCSERERKKKREKNG